MARLHRHHLMLAIAITALLAGGILDSFFNATAWQRLFSDPNLVLGFALLVLFQSIAIHQAAPLNQGHWNGMPFIVGVMAWALLGFSPAIIITSLAILIAHLIAIRQTNSSISQISWQSIGNHLVLLGLPLLVLHSLYGLLNGVLPAQLFTNATTFARFGIALIGAFLTLPALGIVFDQLSPPQQLFNLRKHLAWNLLLLAGGGVAVEVFIGFGPITFSIIISLMIALNYQQQRVRQTKQDLLERFQHVTVLQHISSAATTQSQPQDVLESIYEEVNQLFDCTLFFIALYDEQRNRLSYPLVYQHDQRSHLPPRQTSGKSLTDYVIRTRQTVHYRADDPALNDLQATRLTATYLGVPLLIGDDLLGVLGLVHDSNPTAFDQTDQRILETIANQASLVLHNATLYDQNVHTATHLTRINKSLQQVMFNVDHVDAMRVVCDLAANLVSTTKAAIFTKVDDNLLFCTQAVGFDERKLPKQALTIQAFPQRVYAVADALTSEYERIRSEAQQGFYRAYVQIPMRVGDKQRGLLIVYHDTVHHHQQTEIDLLKLLANQVTAAEDNANLLRTLEVYATEQTHLMNLSRVSGATLDSEHIIHEASRLLREMIPIDAVMIGIHNPTQQTLTFVPEQQIYGLARTVSHDVWPEVANMLKHPIEMPLRILHSEQADLSAPLHGWMQQNDIKTLALLPLVIDRQAAGLVIVAHSTPYPFRDSEKRLLKMATHQIAPQLHNAHIHALTEEALMQRLQDLTLIEDLAQQISSALDLSTIVSHILNAGLQATNANAAALALQHETAFGTMHLTWYEQHNSEISYYEKDVALTDLVVTILREGELRLIRDTQNTPAYDPITGTVYQSALYVPLQQGEELVGVLIIESEQTDYFTIEHINFIRSLAGHAAVSLQNAQLLNEREHQIETLTTLQKLSLRVDNQPQQAAVVQSILETALDLFTGQAAALYSYEESNGWVTPEQIGQVLGNDQPLESADTAIPTAIIQQVIANNASVIVTDTDQSIYFDQPPTYSGLIAIPILRHFTIYEVLCVLFAYPRTIDTRMTQSAELLVVQAASHLENAALNQTIRAANGRMRTILDATQDGMILLDADGRIQDANLMAEDLLEINLRDNVHQFLIDVLRDDGQLHGLLQLMGDYEVDPKALDTAEYKLGRADNTRHIQTHLQTITGSNTADSDLLILRDITEETQLKRYRAKIQDMVLHDLRSPLSAVISSLYLSLNIMEQPSDDVTKDLESLQATLQTSLDSSNDLLHLIETLRDLPNLRQIQINPFDILVETVVQNAYNAIAANLKSSAILVDFEIDDDAALFYVDMDLIRRVFINLLHNAFKFTPENGRILITADQQSGLAGYIRLMVCDTGPGIPDDKREVIFEEFTQLNIYKPRAGSKGSGLGLNFCKLAVEAHGGSIWVETAGPLSGACIALTLPYEAASLAQNPSAITNSIS